MPKDQPESMCRDMLGNAWPEPPPAKPIAELRFVRPPGSEVTLWGGTKARIAAVMIEGREVSYKVRFWNGSTRASSTPTTRRSCRSDSREKRHDEMIVDSLSATTPGTTAPLELLRIHLTPAHTYASINWSANPSLWTLKGKRRCVGNLPNVNERSTTTSSHTSWRTSGIRHTRRCGTSSA